MGFVKEIAMSAGKTVAKKMAKKAVKKITGSPQKNNSDNKDFLSNATNFVKQAGKEISTSDVIDVVGMATGTSAILGTAQFVGKTALDVKGTRDILTCKVKTLREEGKITQDILDAILCENKNKLEIACDEVFEAERIGKKLKFLSKDEVDDALSLRKAITKTVIHKVLG